jgi:hypothetical protein
VTVAERPGLLEGVKPVFEEANRAWNERDIPRAYGTLPEEFEYQLGPSWPNARPLRGRDEVVSFFEDWQETFPDARTGPLEFIEVDDRRLIVGFSVTGTGRSSGASTEMKIWQLWELTDQLVPIRVTEFGSRSAALEAGGAKERIEGGTE